MADLHLQEPAAFGWNTAKVLEFFGRAPRLHASAEDANPDADLPFRVVLGKFYLVNPPDAEEDEVQYPFWLCKVAHIGKRHPGTQHTTHRDTQSSRFFFIPGMIDGVRSVRVRYLTAFPTLPLGIVGSPTEAHHIKQAMPNFDWYTDDYWVDHADIPDSDVPNHIPITSLNLPVEMIKGKKQYKNAKAVRVSRRPKVVTEIQNWVERFEGPSLILVVVLARVVMFARVQTSRPY